MIRAMAAGVAALVTAGPAVAGTLVIEVWNVRNAKGVVHLNVCPEAKFLTGDCPYRAIAPARAGTVRMVVTGLPAGRYATQVFHDENVNNKVDRAIFGLPKEGIGFSNDAPIHLGPPKWADAVFAYNGADGTMRVKMRYFLGAAGPG